MSWTMVGGPIFVALHTDISMCDLCSNIGVILTLQEVKQPPEYEQKSIGGYPSVSGVFRLPQQ